MPQVLFAQPIRKSIVLTFSLILALWVSLSAAAQDAPPAAGDSPIASAQSLYIPMSDGVELAIDVYLPHNPDGALLPAMLRSTRYIRLFERQQPEGEDLGFLYAGYALVLVDARGSGASGGTRAAELSPAEIADLATVVEWIVAQSWSNGRVGAYGVSYDGDTAEMTVVSQHPAVKIVAPLYADFDVATAFAPGGLINDMFGTNWGALIQTMDANDFCTLAGVEPGPACDGVKQMYSTGTKPVDADPQGEQLAQIIADRANVDIAALTANAQFWDDIVVTDAPNYAGTYQYGDAVESAGVPMLVWASWMDAATADGAIARFLNYDHPQIVVLTPYSHGGVHDANPFNAPDAPLTESSEAQFMQRLAYFDAVLKQGETLTERSITYYTLGANTWTTTDTWPPVGFEAPTRWYLNADGALTPSAPTDSTGADDYTVDFATTTGINNRWYAQLGGDIFYTNHADSGLLTYTTAPLATDVEITGAATVTLALASTHEDGALYIYLEAVAPDGTVTYLTEGGLRLALRRPFTAEDAPYQTVWTRNNVFQSAYEPLVVGETTPITLSLYNTSALIPAGHQLRIAIAGADADTFRRYPAEGTPTLTVQRNAVALSYIEVPMLAR